MLNLGFIQTGASFRKLTLKKLLKVESTISPKSVILVFSNSTLRT